jgi:hypothetical protein
MEVTGHGIGGYRSGCRCAVCRSAETQRERDYRARGGGRVVAMPTGKPTVKANVKVETKPNAVGSAEQAVIDETGQLTSAADRPAVVAAARAMARILDDQQLVSMWPQAARQLQALLDGLRSGVKKKKSGGRLAAVQAMTRAK